MKAIRGYPCSKCKKLTNGVILISQWVSERLTIIRFKKDCCGKEEVRYMTPYDLTHYVKEV